jgi:hypothetical protein
VEAARHAAGSESLTTLVAEARRKVAEARAARAAAAASRQQERERLRKEQQRLRKMEEAKETLEGAIALMEETAGARGVDAVEVAMQAAARHAARSESLAALVTEARDLIEQARAAEAERTRVAAEEAAAAAAAASAERQQLEEQAATLTLQLQQVQAQLGSSVVPPAAPASHPDAEDQCVLCFDAPKDHIIIPCGHVCVCEACAHQLTQMKKPSCPICRGAIQHTIKVFHS